VAVRVETWNQRRWTRPGIELYRDAGDFSDLSALLPAEGGRELRRAPGWSAQVRTDTNGLATVRGAFFDHANTRYVLVGTDGSSHLACAYLDSSWTLSSNATLSTATAGLGGLSMRNVVWWGGYLWVIGADAKVYRGTSYTSALSVFDTSTDHQVLAHAGDRLWVFKTDGLIQRIKSDDSSFYTYLENTLDFDVRWMAGFRSYLLAFARALDGTWQLLRIPNDSAQTFDEITAVPCGGVHPDYGCLFTIFGDQVYWSPGYYVDASGDVVLDVLCFTGSRVESVCTITHAPNTGGSGVPDSAGFLVWRGRLVYYALEGTAQIFKMLVGRQFVDVAPLTATVSAIHPIAASLGGEMLVTAKASNEGVHHLGAGSLSDGYVVSSYLDMGHPGEEKRLERLTVVLDGAASDFKVVVKYRVNDTTSWTTATTGNNTRVVSVGSLGVEFYTLQIRVDLDDDTGGHEDVRITGISAIYTVRE